MSNKQLNHYQRSNNPMHTVQIGPNDWVNLNKVASIRASRGVKLKDGITKGRWAHGEPDCTFIYDAEYVAVVYLDNSRLETKDRESSTNFIDALMRCIGADPNYKNYLTIGAPLA